MQLAWLPAAGLWVPGTARAPPAPRAIRPTRAPWRIWCAPTPISCGRWPVAGDSPKAQGRSHQGGRSHPSDADLGADPAGAAAAAPAAGVPPRRAGGLRDLDASDALDLLAVAPDPARAARLTRI